MERGELGIEHAVKRRTLNCFRLMTICDLSSRRSIRDAAFCQITLVFVWENAKWIMTPCLLCLLTYA